MKGHLPERSSMAKIEKVAPLDHLGYLVCSSRGPKTSERG